MVRVRVRVRVRMRVRVRIRLAVEPRCLDARLERPGEHLLARGARARLRLRLRPRLRRLAPAAPFGRERAAGLELLREQRVELRGALLGVGLAGQG